MIRDLIRNALRGAFGLRAAPALPLRPTTRRQTCFECGGSGPFHAAHVVPRVVGGTATVPLCEACHGRSHGLDFTDHGSLVREGMRRATTSGKHVGGVPFGWKHGPTGRLIVDAREQYIIARVEAMRGDRMGWADIVAELNKHPDLAPRSGRPWNVKQAGMLFGTRAAQARARAEERYGR